MLLQRLVEHAGRLDAPPPYGYALLRVRYEIHLAADGALQTPGLLDLASIRHGRRPWRAVPFVQRTTAQPPPNLLADRGDFTLGLCRQSSDEHIARANHQAYLDLTSECAEETGCAAVHAVVRFLAGGGRAALTLPPDFDPGAIIEFRVAGRLVTEEAAVRAFWERRLRPQAHPLPCAVCGRTRPTPDRARALIRGLPGANPAGASLVSANRDVAFSYGRQGARVGPICADCADATAKALNALLADRAHCLKLPGAACIFWGQAQPALAVGLLLDSPGEDAAQVLAAADLAQDAVAFYAACLSANNARVVVRDELATTVGEVKRWLAVWLDRQRVVDPFGGRARPLGLHLLCASTVRRPSSPVSLPLVAALLRTALTGAPLPARALSDALLVCRAEGDVTHGRAALIKLTLFSGAPPDRAEELVRLEADRADPAYQCGRLLALLDAAQRHAWGVATRWYGMAVGAPARTFGALLPTAHRHLDHLGRARPGLAGYLRAEIGRASARVGPFPASLGLREQGMFALGFYHQRAHERAVALARTAALRGGEDIQ